MAMRVDAAYLRNETAFSVVGSTVVNIMFFLMVFGWMKPVPVWGTGGYVFDFAPQSFFTALLCTLLPGFIIRRRLAVAGISPNESTGALVVRAVLFGLGALVAGCGGAALVFLGIELSTIEWTTAFTAKLVYGAVVAAAVTPAGLRVVAGKMSADGRSPGPSRQAPASE
ncbi:MAG: hypothetical protein KGL44_13445 [Sphingomonadales bacterium]|nr:hypothetical protein [Sphingomonadales bacterium]